MLTISPINNASYYLEIASEDYYLSGGEPEGIWHGIGSRYLGLSGKMVEECDYRNLLGGFSPSGQALTQNSGQEARRIGWDLTFSAPKSLSLIWARGNDELRDHIQAAQRTAVEQAVNFLERHAAITRRDFSGKTAERVTGLITAMFEHCTSRAQDFQLHTHTLIFNAAPRIDDSWGTIDSREFYRWKKAAGAVYRAELGFKLTQLGFQLESDGDSFHIKGVDKNLCRYFSKRAEIISAELKKSGLKSSASKAGQNIKLMTREYKKDVDRTKLLAGWQKELDFLGFEAEAVGKLKKSLEDTYPTKIEQDNILTDITSKAAIFSKQDIFYSVAVKAIEAGLNAVEAEAVSKSILKNGNLVTLQNETLYSTAYTTEDVIAVEQSMIRSAKILSSRFNKHLPLNIISDAIDKSEEALGFNFDDEQIEAIYTALNGNDLIIIQGSAGAGETTLMLAAKYAYEVLGHSVSGACIAKRAADNLYQETGIKSSTVASLIASLEHGKNPFMSIDVLIIDEAGQLGSPEVQKLLYAAVEANSKVILTGEDKQLDAISRGGTLRYLSRPQVVGTQRMENIRRQRSEWSREMVANFRDGKSEMALQSLDDHGCLHFGDNSAEAKENLIKDWHTYQKENPEKSSLVLAQHWKDVKELSNIIREIYIAEGRVGNENILVTCSIADKQFQYEFSRGDRVKFCKNDYRNLKVSNGTLGTITDIRSLNGDVHVTVQTDDNRKISFFASEYADNKGTNLSLAYALTIYSSQGVTVDGNTFVYYNGGMGRANTYVAASRHKDEVHMYCNAREIDEHLGEISQHEDAMSRNRLLALANLMSNDNYSSLAIEQLPQREKLCEHSLGLDMSI